MRFIHQAGFTFFSRTLVSIFNLFILLITAQKMGAAFRGEVSLLAFALATGVVFAELVAGPVLVFWSSRLSLRTLMRTSYGWCLIVSALFLLPVTFIGLAGNLSWRWIFSLLLVLSFSGANLQILLGRGRILMYNLVGLSGPLYLLISVFVMAGSPKFNLDAYASQLLISYCITFVFGFLAVAGLTEEKNNEVEIENSPLSLIFRSGLYNQASTLFTLLGTRFGFLMLEKTSGSAAVGLYSTALSLAEAILILPGSLSVIVLSKIARGDEETGNRNFILRQVVLSSGLCFVMLMMIYFVPASWFEYLLGKDFIGVDRVLLYLLPGVVLLAGSTIVTHFFSGLGRFRLNALISFSGLMIWVLLTWILSNCDFGIAGICLAYSAGWCVITVLNFWFFLKTDFSEKVS